MNLAISTRWNAKRHMDGEALIAEILALGIDKVELGYDLRMDLVPGVRKMVLRGEIEVVSVHNFCPVPLFVRRGHPEIFSFADSDPQVRNHAVRYTRRTIELAAETGADAVVIHAGNVRMRRYTMKLLSLHDLGQQVSPRYQKLFNRALKLREKKAPKAFDRLVQSIEQLLPDLESNNVRIGIENLPTWEAFPTEDELARLLEFFDTPLIGYWHDTGHGQVRHNLGFSNHANTVRRFSNRMIGMHIHDVRGAGADHMMPPSGNVNFSEITALAPSSIPHVLEPIPGTNIKDIANALTYLRQIASADADKNPVT